jgi:hypothetical protein
MTVIIVLAGLAFFVSLFMAHLASKVADRLFDPPGDRSKEIDDRIRKDATYQKAISRRVK